MNLLELITITSTVALLIAEDLTEDELELLIVLLNQLSNTFTLVLTQRDVKIIPPIIALD